MSGKFAAKTTVSTQQSLAEIKNTLVRYGANQFAYFESNDKAAIGFEFKGRRLRFDIPLPDRLDSKFMYSSRGGQSLSVSTQHDKWEQACRQKWRALALAIKAKLEIVESGIATFEQEFLTYITLPNNQTVGDFLSPQIEAAYENNEMPALLPGVTEPLRLGSGS